MLNVLFVTTPIFILIAIGFLVVKRGILKPSEVPTLGRLVTMVLLPSLIFVSLSQRSFDEVMNGTYLLLYGIGSVGLFMGVLLYCHLKRGQPFVSSTLNALASTCSNSGYIGFPLVTALVGPTATVALALCMIIENAVIIPLALVLAETGQNRKGSVLMSVFKTLALLVKSPVSLSITAGLLASILEIQLPGPLLKAVQMTAGASGALALITIGGMLAGLSLSALKGSMAEILTPAVGKLVLHPLVMMILLLIFPDFDPQLQVAAVAMACSPMLSIYPILSAKYGYDGVAAATLLVGTIASFFTISFAFWLFGATGFLELGTEVFPDWLLGWPRLRGGDM
ncbi:AEC family transporter [Parathalassolituus penaei]|uniref:AEC family transporter n=1 Tax=Parathalassolituus penaei TaxID=2997323 RepID=A0A9X3ITL1_9GAMM|nr:AEC family transporter [Parathalassolituus penaei]MCY0967011.1 AEC family transporter [Parathalassolituus penaei]